MATEQRTATRCMMGSTRGDTEYQRQVPTELTELGMGVDEKRTQWHNRGTRTRWLVCLAGFVLQVPFMGMVMSFGEMLLPLLDTFGGGTVGISWVGSISFGMAYMGNPLSSKLTDMIGARKVATCGVLLGSLGLLLTSFVQSLWLMFITYSIMFGLATNFTYSPPLILTGYWFPDKYHVMATGLQVAGIPFGSLVMNPICQTLLQATGLRTTYRILSALVLILGLACCFMLSSPLPTSERHEFEEGTESGAEIHDRMHAGYHHWIDDMIKRQPDDDSEVSCCGHLTRHRCYLQENLWTDTVFILFMLGQFVKGMGYVFPFIHLINFMHSMGIDPASGAFILTAKGAADMVGRVVAACLGDKLPFDLIHVYVAACGVMALTTYACTFVTDLGGMFFYAISIGFWNGVYNAVLFPVTTSLFSPDVVGQAWAFCQVPPGCAIMIGPALAGAIYDATSSYDIAFYVNMGIFEVAMVIFTCIPAIMMMRKVYEAKGYSWKKQKPTIVDVITLCINEFRKKKTDESIEDDYNSF